MATASTAAIGVFLLANSARLPPAQAAPAAKARLALPARQLTRAGVARLTCRARIMRSGAPTNAMACARAGQTGCTGSQEFISLSTTRASSTKRKEFTRSGGKVTSGMENMTRSNAASGERSRQEIVKAQMAADAAWRRCDRTRASPDPRLAAWAIMRRRSLFDFDLRRTTIALQPGVRPRDSARLLVVRPGAGRNGGSRRPRLARPAARATSSSSTTPR